MMTIFRVIGYVVHVISLCGVGIICWGIILVLRDFLFDLLNDNAKPKRILRQKLGSYLILGLEFFIAADIIRTISRPDWNDIGMLAAIIVLRTILSFFLGMELRNKV
jgi:uncharacterized membrane protein